MPRTHKEIVIDVDAEEDNRVVYITLYCEEALSAYDVKTAIAQHFAETYEASKATLH